MEGKSKERHEMVAHDMSHFVACVLWYSVSPNEGVPTVGLPREFHNVQNSPLTGTAQVRLNIYYFAGSRFQM